MIIAALADTNHAVFKVVFHQCGYPMIIGHVLTILSEHFRCNRLVLHMGNLHPLQRSIGTGQVFGHQSIQSCTLKEAGVQFRDEVIVLLVIMQMDNSKPTSGFLFCHPLCMLLGQCRIDHRPFLFRYELHIQCIQLFFDCSSDITALFVENSLHRIQPIFAVVDRYINITHR